MGATKSSVSGTRKETLDKLLQAGGLILHGKRGNGVVEEFGKACQAVIDDIPFEVVISKPASFGQFLELDEPTQAAFNQLASELPWWQLLDQIEESCFLQDAAIKRARPFIKGLWKSEVVSNIYKPPAGWKYLPVEEAVKAYQKVLGSSLRADSVLKLAKQAKPRKESEGVAVWVKLTTLAKLFGISLNPLEDSEGGREAYAKILELVIPEVGKVYTKAYPDFFFKNWLKGQLTAGYVALTPACRKAWQRLESASEDDFVIAPAGANTGSLYANHSVRHSRLKIVLAGDQFPQDPVMAGGTIATQPERLAKHEHLGIDCPGAKYASDADGQFSRSFYFDRSGGRLHFGCGWAGDADPSDGSAVGFW